MKVRIRFKHWIPKMIGVYGITLYPFILLSCSKDEAINLKIIEHEWIHVCQVRRVGWIYFYASYLWQYVKNRISMNQGMAYQSITYEAEAYAGQDKYVLPEEAKTMIG